IRRVNQQSRTGLRCGSDLEYVFEIIVAETGEGDLRLCFSYTRNPRELMCYYVCEFISFLNSHNSDQVIISRHRIHFCYAPNLKQLIRNFCNSSPFHVHHNERSNQEKITRPLPTTQP